MVAIGSGTASADVNNVSVKCSHGQTYDSTSNNCTGTAVRAKFCNVNDNSCNGGTNEGPLNGTSEAYTACNGLSLSGKTWRVPTKNELKLLLNCTTVTEMPNDGSTCTAVTAPAVTSIFPNTQSSNYKSSTGNSGASGAAWDVTFNFWGVASIDKSLAGYIRCVSE